MKLYPGLCTHPRENWETLREWRSEGDVPWWNENAGSADYAGQHTATLPAKTYDSPLPNQRMFSTRACAPLNVTE